MDSFFIALSALHFLNDGYKAAYVLLLPFIAKDLSLNYTQVGFLAMVVNSVTTLLAIPAGYLSGKYGGLKLLCISILIYAIGFVITGFSYSQIAITGIFFITAFGFGAFHTVGYALVAKTTHRDQLGRRMGDFTAIGDMGKISISSALTSLVGLVGWHLTSVIFGAIAFFVGMVSYFFNFRKHFSHGTETLATNTHSVTTTYKHLLKNKTFIFVNLCSIFDTFASGSLYIFIPFLLLHRHVPIVYVGFLTATFFLGNIVGKITLGRIVDKFGNLKVFILSEILMAVFIVVLSNVTFIIGFIGASIVLGAFTKGTSPIISTLVSFTVKHEEGYEKAYALNNLTTGLASTVAPIVLGLLSDKFGVIAAFNISALFALLAVLPAFGIGWVKKLNSEEALEYAE